MNHHPYSRRQRRKQRSLAVLLHLNSYAGTLILLFAGRFAFAIDHLQYDVVEPVVVGQTINLLVEAWSKPPDSRRTDTRNYLVSIDLNSADKVQHKVVGPIVPNTTDSLIGRDRLEFDRELYGALPIHSIYLSSDGTLIKDVLADDSHLRRWSLLVEGDSAYWKDEGLRPRLHLLSSFQSRGSYFESISGRYIVERDKDEKIYVYDIQMGRRLEDRWLERAATDLFQRADLADAVVVLTDDLRFVVAFPRLGSSDDRFAVDTKSYPKSNYGLVYERAADNPRVFSGMRTDDRDRIPLHCFSDDGKFLCLKYTKSSLSLSDFDGHVVKSLEFDDPMEWVADYGVRVRHDANNRSIALFLVPTIRLHPDQDKVGDTLHIVIWQYAKSQITSYSISMNPLFKITDKGFYPVSGISIEAH